MPLEDALRLAGFDQLTLARAYAGLLRDLTRKKDEPKLLLDLLKETTKFFWAPPRAADRGPVQVVLVHNVPRPAREFTQQAIELKEPQ
jgi:hypothetical protein